MKEVSLHPEPVIVRHHLLTVDDYHKMAEAGIPEAWLIDLQQERVEIYLQPSSEGYRQILRSGKNQQIAFSLLPNVSILIADLWPR